MKGWLCCDWTVTFHPSLLRCKWGNSQGTHATGKFLLDAPSEINDDWTCSLVHCLLLLAEGSMWVAVAWGWFFSLETGEPKLKIQYFPVPEFLHLRPLGFHPVKLLVRLPWQSMGLTPKWICLTQNSPNTRCAHAKDGGRATRDFAWLSSPFSMRARSRPQECERHVSLGVAISSPMADFRNLSGTIRISRTWDLFAIDATRL